MIHKLLRKFFPVGSRNEIERLIWLEKTLKKIPQGNRILDAGAGELTQKRFCSHLSYVSQDFGKYDGTGDSKGLQTVSWDNTKLDIVCDITEIPEPNESFDAIMCIEVFEHIPNPIAAIKEFSRLLKEEGYLILTAPFCSLTHFAPFHFYSGFNKYFYEKHLEEYGFEILEIESNGNFFEFIAQELNRLPSCAKKYSKGNISFLDKILIGLIHVSLNRLSRKDIGSSELLNFGQFVLARKKS